MLEKLFSVMEYNSSYASYVIKNKDRAFVVPVTSRLGVLRYHASSYKVKVLFGRSFACKILRLTVAG